MRGFKETVVEEQSDEEAKKEMVSKYGGRKVVNSKLFVLVFGCCLLDRSIQMILVLQPIRPCTKFKYVCASVWLLSDRQEHTNDLGSSTHSTVYWVYRL